MKRNQMILFGMVGLAAVFLLTRKPSPVYYPPVTGNQNRDSKVSNILAAAAAAGAGLTAIAKLIAQLTSSNDSKVDSYYNQAFSGGDTPTHYPDGTTIDYGNYA